MQYRPRIWQIDVVVFLLLWASFAYFHHTRPGWNVNSRFCLTRALVERGQVRIDDYWNTRGMETEDVAVFKGHYFSDKIIGTSLLGCVPMAVLRGIEKMRGNEFSVETRRYVVTTFSVGLLAAASAILLLHLLRVLFAAAVPEWALVALVLATFLGTQVFFYATLFMSYLPAQFFSLLALLLFEGWRARQEAPTRPAPLFLVGLCLGGALLCEYTYGIVVVALLVYIAFQVTPRASLWKAAAGVAITLVPFAVYTMIVFGKLSIPYQYEMTPAFREYMSRGVMGATSPKPWVIYLLTFHPFRGIFFQSPFLVLALGGLVAMLMSRQLRGLGCVILFASAGLLLYNSGYYMWWGGWAFGPRHLMPAVALLAIAAATALKWRAGRLLLILLAPIGIMIHTMVNATEPQFPDRKIIDLQLLLNASPETHFPFVFKSYVWPLFWNGAIDSNLGKTFGLNGPVTLLPLMVFWSVSLGLLFFLLRHKDSEERRSEQH